MRQRLTNPTTKICAMCQYWNGLQGGRSVKPCTNRKPFFEYDPEEMQLCYKTYFSKNGGKTCGDWVKKY